MKQGEDFPENSHQEVRLISWAPVKGGSRPRAGRHSLQAKRTKKNSCPEIKKPVLVPLPSTALHSLNISLLTYKMRAWAYCTEPL